MTVTASLLSFVLWTCCLSAPAAAVNTTAARIEQFLSKIKSLPSNDDDIKAVNILNCLQDSSWKLLRNEYTDHDYRRLTDQALVTRSIFRGGLGANRDLNDLKDNHTLFRQHYEDWTKSENYTKCRKDTETVAAESMPADKETHPCRLRCQCNVVYHYVSNFKNRVGDVQKIALKFEYLDEEWILTGEYHRDFERYEIGKHIYPPDMEILRTFFEDCR